MALKKNGEKSFTIKDMCRGDGKIYAVIEAAPELAGFRLNVRSELSSGSSLPAKLIDGEVGGQKIIVLPIVGTTQICKVTAVDDAGNEVAGRALSINQHVAHLRSAANRLRKNKVIRQICDRDDRLGASRCEVRLDRIICGGMREGAILHGRILCTSGNRSDVVGDIELRFIGYNGLDCAVAPWILMRDEITKHPDDPSTFMRELQFSVRVDESARGVTVWALPQGRSLPQAFRTLDPAAFNGMVGDWYRSTTDAFIAPGYDRWYRNEHAVGVVELELQAKTRFSYEPKFSVIVPLYHTPPFFFSEMVDSVLKQSYSNLELVLINSTPGDEALRCLVTERAQSDDRVVVVELEGNRGITENTNAGIAAATGDFLCFLDHDDIITEDALFCYARALNKYPETDLLYSDEDHIDAKGLEYSGPYFKPDWEPDLLLGMNYVCHFLCVRKSIVDELEPATREFDGSQDHHMALRVSERARNVYHERRILYHWRVHPLSTADSNIEAKPYAVDAGFRVIQSHLDRCGIKGKVSSPKYLPERYEVIYELGEEPLVSILIPSKDNVPMLDRCVRSIVEKSTYVNYEILIIENNSEEAATFEYYGRLQGLDSRIRVVRYGGPFNYSAVNNFGAREALGDYLLLLNNDTEVITENWLERMLGLCMREGTGVVGAKLLYPDGTIQHCGVISTPFGPGHVNAYRDIGDFGYVHNTEMRQDFTAVTGACLMTKKALYDQLGGLDERLAVSYNDIDYCYAVHEAGKLVVLEPGVELFHYESASRGYEVTAEKRLRFTRERALLMAKWPERFTFPDPCSNPNLSQTSGYFQMRS